MPISPQPLLFFFFFFCFVLSLSRSSTDFRGNITILDIFFLFGFVVTLLHTSVKLAYFGLLTCFCPGNQWREHSRLLTLVCEKKGAVFCEAGLHENVTLA